MDCNRDEANTAREIAEKRLLNDDITGAKAFAVKAQTLFPQLEGLTQFIEIIDLYEAYAKKINGETNYYAVLGVDPFASEEVLRKQYKRRALALHPDKNRSVGADGAFKLLSEAWGILSDKEKKAAYDLKLNIGSPSQTGSSSSSIPRNTAANATPQHASTTTANAQHMPTWPRSPMTAGTDRYSAPQDPTNQVPHTSSQPFADNQNSPFAAFIPQRMRNWGPPSDNQYNQFRNPQMRPSYETTAPTAAPQFVPVSRPPSRPQHSAPVRNPIPTTSNANPLRPESFWTSCSSCKRKFRFCRRFLDQILHCTQCDQPFLATEIPTPSEDIPRKLPSRLPQALLRVFAASSSGSRNVPASDEGTTEAASGSGLKRRRE